MNRYLIILADGERGGYCIDDEELAARNFEYSPIDEIEDFIKRSGKELKGAKVYKLQLVVEGENMTRDSWELIKTFGEETK